MATQFSFPTSPVVGQIASLPDGNQAQWNGYAWVEIGGSGITTYFTDTAPPGPKFGDRWCPNALPPGGGVWVDLIDAGSVVYPVAVNKGGTGATDATGARTNLGIDPWLVPVRLQDGTLAAPGLAFASASGSGLSRVSATQLAMSIGGKGLFSFLGDGTGSTLGIGPGTASTTAQVFLQNQPNLAPNYNYLTMYQGGGSDAAIVTGAIGSATRGNLVLDAPQVRFNDGTVAAPGLAFLNEPGLGWYRNAAGYVGFAVGGQTAITHNASTTAQTTLGVFPQVAGSGQLYLSGQPLSSPNRNNLIISQASSGAATIQTAISGSATRGNLTLDAATVNIPASGLSNVGLNVSSPGNSAGIQFQGGGGSKTLRAGANSANNLEVVNHAFNNVIFSLDDGGKLDARYGFQCKSGANAPPQINAFNIYYNGGGSCALYVDTTLLGTINTTSDERVKKDIRTLAADESVFMAIRPIRYRFGDIGLFNDDGREHWGFSAQNLIKAKANATYGDIEAVQENGDPQPASIDVPSLLAQTVVMVQALNARLAALEAA